MEKILRYFLSLFPTLSVQLQEELINTIKLKEMKKKDMLLNIGQVCKNIYFIETGLFRCYYLKKEKEVCSWFMKEGDVMVSVNSFFTQTLSYEAIQALEDAVVHYISFSELQDLYQRFLEFNVIRGLLLEKYYRKLDEQLYAIKMQKAKERYAFLLTNYPDIVRRVPSMYIASYLGITLETLSRMKGKK